MDKIFKVGDPQKSSKGSKHTPCYYGNIPVDKEGYADALKYIPRDFDLCDLILDNGRCVPGWHDSFRFVSYRIKGPITVLKWKRPNRP